MKRFIFALLCIFVFSGCIAQKKYLSTTFSDSTLERIIKHCDANTFTPVYGNPYWDSIPEMMKQSYISKGEQLIGCNWESMPITMFSEYKENGDRDRYQNVIFGKRNKLMSLFMAELMEHKGRFMPDIINGLMSTCEETWWGIPAHYGQKMPVAEQQTLDLFNAETGGMMAWIYYTMKGPITKFSPLLTNRIKQEIERRILTPGLTHNDWWRTSAMNWNPWICSNWLACTLMVEDDKAMQIKNLRKIFSCLDLFMDQYPEDGGCDEGPSYWERATSSLCDCLWLLDKVSNGKINLSNSKKLKAMGTYLCKMNIGNGYGVNFADAGPRLMPNVNSVYSVGSYLHDKSLCSYAAYLAVQEDFLSNPTKRGEYLFCLNRELMLLSQLNGLKSYNGNNEMHFDAYLPNLQVVTARSYKNSLKGLFVAAKGGNNGESHNHNDVGSFIIYQDSEPMLVDPGVGTYRKETFNNATRYNIWTMQSCYHNLPRINGVNQMYGKKYAAKDAKETANNKRVAFSLDIASAYPDSAKIKSWVRTIDFVRGKYVDVAESYELGSIIAPTEIMLITPVEPVVTNGKIILHSSKIHSTIMFNPSELDVSSECINMNDEKMTHIWNKLYRIKMRVKGNNLKNVIRYRISE